MKAEIRIDRLGEGQSFTFKKRYYTIIAVVLGTGERITKSDEGRKEIWYRGETIVEA